MPRSPSKSGRQGAQGRELPQRRGGLQLPSDQSQAFLSPSPGQFKEPVKCGACSKKGMCPSCSMCDLCGKAPRRRHCFGSRSFWLFTGADMCNRYPRAPAPFSCAASMVELRTSAGPMSGSVFSLLRAAEPPCADAGFLLPRPPASRRPLPRITSRAGVGMETRLDPEQGTAKERRPSGELMVAGSGACLFSIPMDSTITKLVWLVRLVARFCSFRSGHPEAYCMADVRVLCGQ